MRGRLAEARKRKKALVRKCEYLADGVRQALNPALDGVESMDVDRAFFQMGELSDAWAEMLAVSVRIARLEKELS